MLSMKQLYNNSSLRRNAKSHILLLHDYRPYNTGARVKTRLPRRILEVDLQFPSCNFNKPKRSSELCHAFISSEVILGLLIL
jgi:hypothetical protein